MESIKKKSVQCTLSRSVSKFCDALPFYRQERQFQRMGVDVSRQDITNWTLKVFERVNAMLALLRGDTRDPKDYKSLLPWNGCPVSKTTWFPSWWTTA